MGEAELMRERRLSVRRIIYVFVLILAGIIWGRSTVKAETQLSFLSLPKQLTVYTDEMLEIKATTNKIDPEEDFVFYIWNSSNYDVLDINGDYDDATAVVTGINPGTATIVLEAGGKKATCSVKVINPINIKLSFKTKTIAIGKKTKLKAKISKRGYKATFSSSNSKVASVTNKGVITAKKPGKAKIVVRAGKSKAVCTVTVKKTILKISEQSVNLYKGSVKKLKVKILGKKGKIKWKSSKPGIVQVNSKGVIKAKKTGHAVITAKFNGTKVKCNVYVRTRKAKRLSGNSSSGSSNYSSGISVAAQTISTSGGGNSFSGSGSTTV